MPNPIDTWGKKAASILSILALVALIGTYAGGMLPNYALSSDLKAHIEEADDRYFLSVRNTIKKEIKLIENRLALYELDKASRPLTPREKLDERQLINLKAEYLRDLQEMAR